MKDVKKLFGLMLPGDADADKNPDLVLTDYEVDKLKTAYQKTLLDKGSKDYSQAEYVLYGTYEPFSVTVTHILNNKSGINFASYAHTGLPVPVFAQGAGSSSFEGYYDNTDVYNKIAEMLQVKLDEACAELDKTNLPISYSKSAGDAARSGQHFAGYISIMAADRL